MDEAGERDPWGGREQSRDNAPSADHEPSAELVQAVGPRRQLFRALVAYDGSRFHGWQIQPDVRTVQGEIHRAVADLTGVAPRSAGAGRTDAGVHALGQVVTLEMATPIPAERLADVLNSRLPDDVRIHRLEPAPAGFHARFSARWRCYWYFLARERNPFLSRWSFTPPSWPEIDLMNEAMQPLLGEHDFRALSAEPAPPYGSSLLAAEWAPSRTGAVFVVRADRFLYRMVRFLVAASLVVGTGKERPAWAGDVLRSLDRRRAAPPAPPQGLFLAAIGYAPAWPEGPLPLVSGFDAPAKPGYGAT